MTEEMASPDIGTTTASLTPPLGLALSGGGVRSSLFSLGVILYLVDSGLNNRVWAISSVSGGSVTNGALAASGDISQASPQDFYGVCRRLASGLAKKGTFFIPRLRMTLPFLATVAALSLLGGLATVRPVSVPLTRQMWILSYAMLTFVSCLVGVWLVRGSSQRTVFSQLLEEVANKRGPWARRLMNRPISTSAFADYNVIHVFVATELTLGEPIYLSGTKLYSPHHKIIDVTASGAAAIYASAAFPGVFRPIRFPSRSLRQQSGEKFERLLLADGGLHSNLGEDWFDLMRGTAQSDSRIRDIVPSRPTAFHTLLVNASAAARETTISRWPVKRTIESFIRSMTVMQMNTVRPRVKQLNSGRLDLTMIDVAVSPIDRAEELSRHPGTSPAGQRRAMGVLRILRSCADPVKDIVEETALERTTLGAIGPDRAARLLYHGYVSAMVELNVRFAAVAPHGLPSYEWFLDFTRRKRP